MAHYSVKRFEPADSEIWDAFVRKSKNGTFLFERGFMDYHSDRFDDHSLMVFEGLNLLAVLPAHRIGDRLFSHLGLTYGGLVYGIEVKLNKAILALHAILKYLDQAGIVAFQAKAVPSIYCKVPSDEFSYALFVAGAKLLRRDSLSAIDLQVGPAISKTREQSIRRGQQNGLEIREESNFALFWDKILIPNLAAKHAAQPVHSVSEIEMLHKRFPSRIRQFNVYSKGEIVAGTTIFETDTVAHAQYISANSQKNELGSLDFLFHHLIAEVFRSKRFFDFGTSNEEQGRKLNQGLAFWKESFGASTITQDFYEVQSGNFRFLENVLV